MKAKVESGELGTITGGMITYRGNFEADYNGIYFYGSHSCEACMKIFGYDVKSVVVNSLDPENFTIAVKYDDKLVTIALSNRAKDKYFLVANGTADCTCKALEDNFRLLCKLGITDFVEMLRNRICPITPGQLVMPVYMLRAIDRSYSEGREVTIEEVK